MIVLKTKIPILLFLLLTALTGSSKAQNSQEEKDDTPIKVNTVLLNVPVIVSDKDGRNIAGLKKEDFSVYQNGEKQTIEFFADTEAPMNVAIVIDTSSSTKNVIGNITGAARNFIELFDSEDKGMIVSFDYDVRILSKLTSDKKKMKEGISGIWIAEEIGSNMNDALYKVVIKEFAAIKGRKAIVVLTDGFVGGRISNQKLLDTLTESDVLVYPIFFQTVPLLPSKVKTITMNELLKIPPVDYLNSIALATGGRVYAAESSNFQGAFQSIAEELKKQYVVGFYPKAEKPRKLTIKVSRPGAIVRTRQTIKLQIPTEKDDKSKN